MNIKCDSRKVEKGDIFVALRGHNQDGHDYIKEAITRGAKKIIAEEGLYETDTLIVKNTHDYLIQYLKDTYGTKIEKLKLIGMTGTNGKTTTCYLLQKALNQLGHKCGYIGTIGFYIDEKIRDLNNTTPDILDLYEMLLECVDAGCVYVSMEVSSHALDMKRVEGLTYDMAIFSNLTKDHLDYHLDMKSYALAKQKLFQKVKPDGMCFINNDDDYKNFFILKENHNTTYGIQGGDYKIIDYHMDMEGTSFQTLHNEQVETYQMKLIGKHNLYNMQVVIMVLHYLKIEEEKIKEVIASLAAPSGRMQFIHYLDNLIIVDYAHTPDAVKNMVETVSELAHNHIYTLIGCGGNRDKTKRPEMAFIATNLSTTVIFTSDNPRKEDPELIIQDMLQGLDNTNYEIIVNRKEAIKRGIQMLEKGDILLLLGKGHEAYQVIGTEKVHFDDLEEVENIINNQR